MSVIYQDIIINDCYVCWCFVTYGIRPVDWWMSGVWWLWRWWLVVL